MRISFFILLFICFFGLSGQNTNIRYEIKNAADSFYILGYHFDDQRLIFDTLENKDNGILRINYEESIAPGLYFIYGPSSQFYQELIINEQAFELITDGTYEGTSVVGSEENNVFFAFQRGSLEIQKRIFEYNEALQEKSGDDSLEVVDKLRDLDAELSELRNSLKEEKPELLACKILELLGPVALNEENYAQTGGSLTDKQRYAAYRERFRARLDFEEEGLIRTPVFKRSVMRYFTEVIPQIPDSIVIELDRTLGSIESDSLAFKYWLINFTNYYQNSKIMGMTAVLVHLLDHYYLSGKAYWLDEISKIKIAQEVKAMKPNQVGQIAPSLMLSDTANIPTAPLELPSEYLVLYFYDPDCGVCKKKTPILKANYASLKELGAEVIAINIASETKKWKTYIVDNDLPWINLADPEYRSAFREEYNIKSTPFLFVLDKNRKIIAKKLGVEQVSGFISDYKTVIGQ